MVGPVEFWAIGPDKKEDALKARAISAGSWKLTITGRSAMKSRAHAGMEALLTPGSMRHKRIP